MRLLFFKSTRTVKLGQVFQCCISTFQAADYSNYLQVQLMGGKLTLQKDAIPKADLNAKQDEEETQPSSPMETQQPVTVCAQWTKSIDMTHPSADPLADPAPSHGSDILPTTDGPNPYQKLKTPRTSATIFFERGQIQVPK